MTIFGFKCLTCILNRKSEIQTRVHVKTKARHVTYVKKHASSCTKIRSRRTEAVKGFTYVCVSGGKKCSFFGKFDVLRFFEIPVLKFALLPYYRRIIINSNIFRHIHVLLRHIPIKPYCGIFSTLCNSCIFSTLPYSESWHI